MREDHVLFEKLSTNETSHDYIFLFLKKLFHDHCHRHVVPLNQTKSIRTLNWVSDKMWPRTENSKKKHGITEYGFVDSFSSCSQALFFNLIGK